MRRLKVKINFKMIKLGLRCKKCIFSIHCIINFQKLNIQLKVNNKEGKNKMEKIIFKVHGLNFQKL